MVTTSGTGKVDVNSAQPPSTIFCIHLPHLAKRSASCNRAHSVAHARTPNTNIIPTRDRERVTPNT